MPLNSSFCQRLISTHWIAGSTIKSLHRSGVKEKPAEEITHMDFGALGVVMGALGLLTVPSLILPKQQKANAFRLIAGGLLAGVLIFVMIGVNPETDVVAHLGGFVTGWLLGLVLARVSRFTRRPRVNLVAGILYALLIIIPWFLALSAL